jgi:hypothetical protein
MYRLIVLFISLAPVSVFCQIKTLLRGESGSVINGSTMMPVEGATVRLLPFGKQWRQMNMANFI